MDTFHENDKITIIYDKDSNFEARIPGYFINIVSSNPAHVFYYTSALRTCATHTSVILQKSTAIIGGWATADASRVQREAFIEKQLQKLN